MIALEVGIALSLGAVTWSLLEYCIHRWAGHDPRFRPNAFAKEHIRHHIEGDYFAPTWKKGSAALILFAIIVGPAVLVGGVAAGLAYCAGLVGFYLFYEVLHRLEHVKAGFGFYGRWARRHHFYHHFVDARFNHGVTSPLWDLVFGTYRTTEVIAVPKRLMMPWLGDPETGVRPELAAHYTLKVSKREREAASQPKAA
ncbi:MAG: sterol desaturase family protein [Sandaracinaceae bacterium]|nr:sterol desaturase family protein [Sandaracinaceae bacterium]